jgi:hypothetical protein
MILFNDVLREKCSANVKVLVKLKGHFTSIKISVFFDIKVSEIKRLNRLLFFTYEMYK